MQVQVPYGHSRVNLNVEADCEVVTPKEVECGNETQIIIDALEHPIGMPPFKDFCQEHSSILFIVTDGTRPTPVAKLLEHLLPMVPDEVETSFMVANGTHRNPNEEELKRIFESYLESIRDKLYFNECRNDDALRYLGTTSRSTLVRFNKRVINAEALVTINNVKPHYFAGFTGGRKIFLPGVASWQTIEKNHSNATNPNSMTMALNGNPVHEDMEEAAKLLYHKPIFTLNTVVTGDHRLYSLSAGDLLECFYDAVGRAKEVFTSPLRTKASVVITANVPPMDISLYQSQHALENCKHALADGGVMILVSQCRDGLGNPEYLEFLDNVENMEDVEQHLAEGYTLGDHKAARIMQLRDRAELWIVSDLPDEGAKRSKMKPYHDLQKALDEALDLVREKGMPERVLVLPNGGMTLPKPEE